MNEVDDYVINFPINVQEKLIQIRTIIKNIAPEAVESIAYGMPAYKLYGKPLVYFAGYKKHIGFYATPTGHQQFTNELSKYKQGKGSVQFPLCKPIPYDLIIKIVNYRALENLLKMKK